VEWISGVQRWVWSIRWRRDWAVHLILQSVGWVPIHSPTWRHQTRHALKLNQTNQSLYEPFDCGGRGSQSTGHRHRVKTIAVQRLHNLVNWINTLSHNSTDTQAYNFCTDTAGGVYSVRRLTRKDASIYGVEYHCYTLDTALWSTALKTAAVKVNVSQ